jgi:YVTN family beta-propeller protein
LSPTSMRVDNSHLFVANRLSNSVSKINLATRLVEKTTAVGTHPFGLAIDTQFIYSAKP